MTDRELLELAAKAAGVPVNTWSNCQAGGFLEAGYLPERRERFWNPLTDDGDALRLAVKLCMQVECSKGYQHVSVYGHSFTISECHDGYSSHQDPNAAARRAIVRAAAALAATP